MYNAERGVIDTYLIFSGNVESNSHKLFFVSDILSTFILWIWNWRKQEDMCLPRLNYK